MKRKIQIALCPILAILTVLSGVFGGVFLSRSVQGKEIFDFGEPSVAESAPDGSAYYVGTKTGKVVKIFADGRKKTVVPLKDGYIEQIIDFGDRTLVVCDTREFYLYDGDMNLLASDRLEEQYLGAVYEKNGEEETITFAMSTRPDELANDLLLCRYSYSDGKLRETIAPAFFRLYDEESDTLKRAEIRVRSFFSVPESEWLYVFTMSGAVYRFQDDLSVLTTDLDAYLEAAPETYRFEDQIYAASETGKDEFLVALRNRQLYRLGDAFEAEIFATLDDIPSSLRYEEESDTLYVSYELFDSVTAFDAETGRRLFDFFAAYHIFDMAVCETADVLLILYREDSNTHLLSFPYGALYLQVRNRAAGTVLAVISALLLATTLLFALCLCSRKFASALRRKTHYFFSQLLRHRYIYLLLLPPLILLAMFCYYPAVASIVNAFYDYSLGTPRIFNGFENFTEIFQNRYFGEMCRNLVIFLTTDCILALAPPIFFALCLSLLRSKRFSKASRILLFFHGIIPGIATALLWKNGIYGDYGVINTIIKALGGTPIPFFAEERYSIASLVFMGFPFIGSYLIFYGALMNIPQEIYESAELEGCKLFRRVFCIDIPFIRGQVKYVFVMTFIHSVQSLGKVRSTTQGGAGTMTSMYMMYSYLTNNEYGLASALAVLMLLVLSFATYLNMRSKSGDAHVS